MTTITIPAELETPLAEAAKRRGTTPEFLAVECLRQAYASQPADNVANGQSLAEFLQGYVGAIAGSSEPWSERTGQRFAAELEDRARGDRS